MLRGKYINSTFGVWGNAISVHSVTCCTVSLSIKLTLTVISVISTRAWPRPLLTLSLDLQRGPDQGEQRGVEHHRAVAVQRHVHRHQTLVMESHRYEESRFALKVLLFRSQNWNKKKWNRERFHKSRFIYQLIISSTQTRTLWRYVNECTLSICIK